MPWARFDDRFPSNRKIRMLTDGAFRLYVSAICWSAENLTDGFIAHDELLIVSDTRDPESACEELVRRRLWTTVASGWLIHDFHEYNPSADQVRADRKLKAERQARWRENKRRAEAGLPPLDVDASTEAPPPSDGDPDSDSEPVDVLRDASTDASPDTSTEFRKNKTADQDPVDASHDASRSGAPRARVPAPPRPAQEVQAAAAPREPATEPAAAAAAPKRTRTPPPRAVPLVDAVTEKRLVVGWNLYPAQWQLVVDAIDRSGIPALVEHALRCYQPNNPPRYATAWLDGWSSLPPLTQDSPLQPPLLPALPAAPLTAHQQRRARGLAAVEAAAAIDGLHPTAIEALA